MRLRHRQHHQSAWLELVERWFGELTDRRLRRSNFTSVANSSPPSRTGLSTGAKTLDRISGTTRGGDPRQDPTRPEPGWARSRCGCCSPPQPTESTLGALWRGWRLVAWTAPVWTWPTRRPAPRRHCRRDPPGRASGGPPRTEIGIQRVKASAGDQPVHPGRGQPCSRGEVAYPDAGRSGGGLGPGPFLLGLLPPSYRPGDSGQQGVSVVTIPVSGQLPVPYRRRSADCQHRSSEQESINIASVAFATGTPGRRGYGRRSGCRRRRSHWRAQKPTSSKRQVRPERGHDLSGRTCLSPSAP
jgi:hypothetical protein